MFEQTSTINTCKMRHALNYCIFFLLNAIYFFLNEAHFLGLLYFISNNMTNLLVKFYNQSFVQL